MIPTQLHRKELKQILKQAAGYLPFLNETDAYGTVADIILSIFDFRIPYYVGPLNPRSEHAWVIRTNKKILPWNPNQVVDRDASGAKFMKPLIGRSVYTGAPLLPKNSLLYSEFILLNELNPLRVNGNPLDNAVKLEMIQALFYDSNKLLTKKSIEKYLCERGHIKK